MYHSAKTRRENIVKSEWYNAKIHLVFNVPIQDIAEVVTTVPSSIDPCRQIRRTKLGRF